MSEDTENALRASLDGIDQLRRRMYVAGWLVVLAALGVYGRLAYLRRTTDDLEVLLSASVSALSFLIVWATFVLALVMIRMTKRILRAIYATSQGSTRIGA